MKKNNLQPLLFLLSVLSPCSASATYTNTVPPEYASVLEYNANGQALTAIGADKAYTGSDGTIYTGFSGKGVTVAVIDTGALLTHEDLKGNISKLQGEGFNDYSSAHGTHVAGIIGAEKNDLGMHGVAYESELLSFSTLLAGECQDDQLCMSTEEAWNELTKEEYDAVKIINNSWSMGTKNYQDYTAADWTSGITAAKGLVEKDKLIVASAGNDMKMYPNVYPAGLPYFDSSLALNTISVIAYDSAKTPDDKNFIAGFSNLALNAQKWSLSAPGASIFSTVTGDTGSVVNAYDYMSGTSMAAPVVSGAAALVQEAFPFLGGKQIADVLFSTADNDFSGFSDHMVQSISKDSGTTYRFLFFGTQDGYGKEWTNDEKNAIVATELGAGKSCSSEGVYCNNVSYQDVFGQGLLNVADAVKGLAVLDAARLTTADFNQDYGQFFYTVNTQGLEGTWSNDIGQKKYESESEDPTAEELQYAGADLGLKKEGAGTLTLAGDNTFAGTSVVNEGTLELSGKMAGAVEVNSSGTFALTNGQMDGKVVVNKDGGLTVNSGTLNADIQNAGSATAFGGTLNGILANTGTFTVSGVDKIIDDTPQRVEGIFTSANSIQNAGTFVLAHMGTLNGSLENNGILQVTGFSKIQGALNNNASGYADISAGASLDLNGGTFENAGRLSGSGSITGGTVHSTGSVDTTLTLERLDSSGKINISAAAGTTAPTAMTVRNLNITGGSFALSDSEVVYRNGQTYNVINFDTLEGLSNFEMRTMIAGFIAADVIQNANSLDIDVGFIRMSTDPSTSSFNAEERQVASIFDKMYLDADNEEFIGYYYMTPDQLKGQINTIRNQIQAVPVENLPLTNTMSSNVYTHLFQVQSSRDTSFYPRPYVPSNNYRGSYYRGRSGGSPETDRKLWVQALGGQLKTDAEKETNRGTAKTTTYGAMFGYDKEISNTFLVGVTGGFAYSELKQDDDEVKVNDYRLGIYAGKRWGRVTLDSIAMGGFQQYKSERQTNIVGLQATSKGDYTGYTAEAGMKLGFDFNRRPQSDHSFLFRTYVSGGVSYISQESYKEKGSSSMNLRVGSVSDTSVTVQPGLTIGYMWSDAVLSADIGYQRLVTGGTPRMTAYFLADTTQTSFDSLPSDIDKDYLMLGLGFKEHLSRNTLVNLWLGSRLSDKTSAFSASVTVSYEF